MGRHVRKHAFRNPFLMWWELLRKVKAPRMIYRCCSVLRCGDVVLSNDVGCLLAYLLAGWLTGDSLAGLAGLSRILACLITGLRACIDHWQAC